MKSLVLGLLGLFVFSPVVYANSEQSPTEALFNEIQRIRELNLESIIETLLLQLRYRLSLSQAPSSENDQIRTEIYSILLNNGIPEDLKIMANIQPSSLFSWLEKRIQSLADSFKITIERSEFNITTLSKGIDYPPRHLLSFGLLNPLAKALNGIENDFNYEDESGAAFPGNWGPDAKGFSGTLESLVIHDTTELFRNDNLNGIMIESLHNKIEKYRDQFSILNQYINILNLRGPEDVQWLIDNLLKQQSGSPKINVQTPEELTSTDLTDSIDRYKSYIYLYLGALEKGLQKSILNPISSISLSGQDLLESIKQDAKLLIDDIKAVCKEHEIETVRMDHIVDDFIEYKKNYPNLPEEIILQNFIDQHSKQGIQDKS